MAFFSLIKLNCHVIHLALKLAVNCAIHNWEFCSHPPTLPN